MATKTELIKVIQRGVNPAVRSYFTTERLKRRSLATLTLWAKKPSSIPISKKQRDLAYARYRR